MPCAAGYDIERDLAAAGAGCVAGVDEVGRGAWAAMAGALLGWVEAYAIGEATHAEIDAVTVAAASVIAKVHRDALMAGLGHESFGFAENAGYPSPSSEAAPP